MNPELDDDGKIRITLDDLNRVGIPEPQVTAEGQKPYGNVAQSPSIPTFAESKGSIFMSAWCYLGLAGLAGALLAWGICEPRFRDGGRPTWANSILFPLMLVLVSLGFGVAESIVERSPRKAAFRGLLSLGIGTALGFVFFNFANIIFAIGISILRQSGGFTVKSPGLWLTRAIAWMGFGAAGGLVYGLVGQSGKKCVYGIAGGVAGAALGGLLFDPITMLTGGAGISRAVGMALFGVATGISMGLVEGALKDRWIYVAAGPLAGKQFILYKPLTIIGSDQSCDIYLFKDPSVQPQHASIELRGQRALVRAAGLVLVQGRPVKEAVLESGNSFQIGRYAFLYRDRERVTK